MSECGLLSCVGVTDIGSVNEVFIVGRFIIITWWYTCGGVSVPV